MNFVHLFFELKARNAILSKQDYRIVTVVELASQHGVEGHVTGLGGCDPAHRHAICAGPPVKAEILIRIKLSVAHILKSDVKLATGMLSIWLEIVIIIIIITSAIRERNAGLLRGVGCRQGEGRGYSIKYCTSFAGLVQ